MGSIKLSLYHSSSKSYAKNCCNLKKTLETLNETSLLETTFTNSSACYISEDGDYNTVR